MMCPRCHRTFATNVTRCPKDGATLEMTAMKAVSPNAAEPNAAEPNSAEPNSAEPNSAEPKAEVPKAVPPPRAIQPGRGPKPRAEEPKIIRPPCKVCPTCGLWYETEAVFCGKDGTTLVLFNVPAHNRAM
ncbi:MAG: hypothetical protein FWD57_03630 [Polyangiaceae bacterium]|nr:hypothetical protein [Polyangiaceae bacterium]